MATNMSQCNQCGTLVDASHREDAGKVYLVKHCPDCGETQTLISADARRYANKQGLDGNFEYSHCRLTCTDCRRHKDPNMVFVDITNRCNMNCAICINNTPSMGFLFEPPLEYFDKIFKEVARITPKPAIQLFGGEPTVRKDLFEIIDLARAQGLSVRIATNGLKLADEDYCRKLIKSRTTILIAYDGDNPALYRDLRNKENALDLKLKAFDNIARIGRAKVAVMSLVAKGYNDQRLDALFAFCHKHRANTRGVYLMPLAHTWQDGQFDEEPERITLEDIECRVAELFPDEPIDFIPAGFLGQLPNYLKLLRLQRLPFLGAHPNCESFYLFISDGEKYLPVGRYLKASSIAFCQDLMDGDQRLARTEAQLDRNLAGRVLEKIGLKKRYLLVRATLSAISIFRRNLRIDRVIHGESLLARTITTAKILLNLAQGRRLSQILVKYTCIHHPLQVIVLPFEDPETLESERLERCPAAFAYVDPVDDEVRCVPACAWGLFKKETMRNITERTDKANSAAAEPPAPAVNAAS